MGQTPDNASAKTPLLLTGDPTEKRREIREYFLHTWELYENLFELLKDDSVFYERPEPLRHPLIFYFGHTATFFINKLVVSKIINRRIRPNIESMMAIGVDEMSWDDLDESHYDWPPVDEVRSYRDEVKAIVLDLIDTLPLSLPIDWDSPFWIILMGIEHERIHLETSSVLIRQLPLTSVQSHPNWPRCPDDHGVAPDNKLIDISGGKVHQGRQHPAPTYGWDNEYGTQTTDVTSFKASQFLVSHAEFFTFISEGGYQTREYWTEEGWNWVQYKKATHPAFWIPTDNPEVYKYRTLTEEIDMPWSWPTDVNQLEAKAFCNWLSKKLGQPIRLPSDPEWMRIADLHVDYDEGARTVSPANIDLLHWASACPVDTFDHRGLFDVTGNVWQWTESAIDGFDGFAVHPAYDDFSVPTFDGRHNMIKGGSWISTGNESLRDSRFAFRRHFTQHAGFRYIASETPITQEFNTYESDPEIANELEFHYGESYFNINNFQKSCIDAIFDACEGRQFKKVLDIGCSVGRSSFEIAKRIGSDACVDAVDFSTRYIRNALNLRDHQNLRYLITEEGDITQLKKVSLKELKLDGPLATIDFTQGDAVNLKPIYTGYDLVFAGNLIDHLYEPATFLKSIHKRMNAGGILVITSNYDWDESRTKRKNWLGGIKVNGENKTTLDGLHEVLSDHFDELTPPSDIPFIIRKTARKYEQGMAQITYWVKR